jgi:hypothetical protein
MAAGSELSVLFGGSCPFWCRRVTFVASFAAALSAARLPLPRVLSGCVRAGRWRVRSRGFVGGLVPLRSGPVRPETPWPESPASFSPPAGSPTLSEIRSCPPKQTGPRFDGRSRVARLGGKGNSHRFEPAGGNAFLANGTGHVHFAVAEKRILLDKAVDVLGQHHAVGPKDVEFRRTRSLIHSANCGRSQLCRFRTTVFVIALALASTAGIGTKVTSAPGAISPTDGVRGLMSQSVISKT